MTEDAFAPRINHVAISVDADLNIAALDIK